MTDYYDDMETADPDQREAMLMAALPKQIARAKAHAPGFARILAEVAPSDVASREALAQLPLTRKSDLIELQRAAPPLGGLAATPVRRLARLFRSPGPIADAEAHGRDWWRMARALHAAGFRQGDIVHNCFSYHLTPAGAMLESGALALGCVVFPGGVGNTEAQVEAMAHFRADAYVGTPDFLKVILGKAAEIGADVSSLRKGCVSGAAYPAALRQEFKDRGLTVLQCYASADLGLIAYESSAESGLIVDENVIVEIVRPGTGDPVAAGEVGEVVVTALNPDYPLIRFATGDLSAVLPGQSPCGRTNLRLKGWLGRADQTTKVKGMFVHPQQIARVIKRHPEIIRARLVVSRSGSQDVMTLACETVSPSDATLIEEIGRSLASECKLHGRVELCAPGSLPNDGKIIDDARPQG
jgi:phenylacetate-CoA ligase